MTSSSLAPLIDSNNLKRCSKCGETKPREAFSRYRRNRDGLQPQCKACNAVYHAANRERIAERGREYYAANAEQRREYSRVYHAANREQRREYQRAYLQTDVGKAVHRAGGHNRRARKLATGGTYTTAELDAIRAAQTDTKGRLICWRCGKPIKGTPHLDHWIPLAKGGANDAGNLHFMHAKCNLTKNAKMPAELGRLI